MSRVPKYFEEQTRSIKANSTLYESQHDSRETTTVELETLRRANKFSILLK